MRHRTYRLGIAAPLVLLAIGGCLLFGCIPLLGTFNKIGGDVRPERKIGAADSKRPIRLGAATRERVIEVLGDPALMSEDGRAMVFKYQVVNGYLVWPLCFSIDRTPGQRYLALSFDERDRLTRYKVFKQDDAAAYWLGRGLQKPSSLPPLAPGGTP